MVIEQRTPKAESSFEPAATGARVWQPFTVVGARAARQPVGVDGDRDRYVSVDDIDDGVVSIDVSTWPRLDREGRLHWDEDDGPVEATVPLAELQRWIDVRRRRHLTTAPERPLRIGDVFLLRPVDPTESRRDLLRLAGIEDAFWDAHDVTKAARTEAKMAMLGAATSTVATAEAAHLRLDAPYEEPEEDAEAIDVRQRPPDPEGGPPTGPATPRPGGPS